MARDNPDRPASTSRDRALSAVLREAYERAKADRGLTQRALGELVGTSHATVNRWLSGETVPSYTNVVELVTVLGVVGDEKEAILEVARNPGPNWVAVGSGGLSKELSGVMELERQAESMVVWMPLFVPGMLQTAGYARTVISGSDYSMTDADLQHLVTLRLGRQNAILRNDPIRLHAFVGEPAVRGRIGGRDVMVEQLRYLLRAAEFSTVTLRLVPVDDWHGGLIGPFVRYDFAGGQSIVYLEHYGSGVFLDDVGDVTAYRSLSNDLERVAASEAETQAIIGRELEKWEAT